MAVDIVGMDVPIKFIWWFYRWRLIREGWHICYIDITVWVRAMHDKLFVFPQEFQFNNCTKRWKITTKSDIIRILFIFYKTNINIKQHYSFSVIFPSQKPELGRPRQTAVQVWKISGTAKHERLTSHGETSSKILKQNLSQANHEWRR